MGLSLRNEELQTHSTSILTDWLVPGLMKRRSRMIQRQRRRGRCRRDRCEKDLTLKNLKLTYHIELAQIDSQLMGQAALSAGHWGDRTGGAQQASTAGAGEKTEVETGMLR